MTSGHPRVGHTENRQGQVSKYTVQMLRFRKWRVSYVISHFDWMSEEYWDVISNLFWVTSMKSRSVLADSGVQRVVDVRDKLLWSSHSKLYVKTDWSEHTFIKRSGGCPGPPLHTPSPHCAVNWAQANAYMRITNYDRQSVFILISYKRQRNDESKVMDGANRWCRWTGNVSPAYIYIGG